MKNIKDIASENEWAISRLKEGWSKAKVAEKLGIHPTTLNSRFQSAGIYDDYKSQLKRLPEEKILADFKSAYVFGLSYKELQRRFCIDSKTVWRWAKRLNLSRRRLQKKQLWKRSKLAKELKAEGQSLKQISELFGVCKNTARELLKS